VVTISEKPLDSPASEELKPPAGPSIAVKGNELDLSLAAALRARGEKVPAVWIENPFYRQYYQSMGWSSEANHD